MRQRKSSANPEHHNYGRRQSLYGEFAGRMNWLRMQCLGSHGNLGIATYFITSHAGFKKLKQEYQLAILEQLAEARTCATRLKGISEEIARLNGPDKWATVETPAPRLWGVRTDTIIIDDVEDK